jgi:iron complex transport system substrate-binding protein
MLVGRSHECDWPDWVRGLPECSEPAFDVSGSSAAIDAEVRWRIAVGEELYRVHGDLIRELRPDLVIAQSHCEVCAVTPDDVANSGECLPMLALCAASVQGVLESIGQVAARIGLEERGREVVARERDRLRVVGERTAGLRRPTVVMLEWTDPLFAMGNWGPELVEIANGELLIGKQGVYSGKVAGARVAEADPEFLIVAPCGFGLTRTLREQPVLESYAWWRGLRAVREGKVAFADGNRFFNRSGMSISQTAEIIAEILHGVTFADGTLSGAARGEYWRWMGDVR